MEGKKNQNIGIYTYSHIHTHCAHVSVCVYDVHTDIEEGWGSWGGTFSDRSWLEPHLPSPWAHVLYLCAILVFAYKYYLWKIIPFISTWEILSHPSSSSSGTESTMKLPLILCAPPHWMWLLMRLWDGGGTSVAGSRWWEQADRIRSSYSKCMPCSHNDHPWWFSLAGKFGKHWPSLIPSIYGRDNWGSHRELTCLRSCNHLMTD